jgi:hypothetical protein
VTIKNSYLFNEFVCKLRFFWYEWAKSKRECNERFKGPRGPRVPRVKLTFRFDKLSHLSKSVHIGENSQILTVSNKKKHLIINK